MLMDNNLRLSANQPITAAGATDSTYTYDILAGNSLLTASGTYAVPPAQIIGNAAFFGEDLGRGRGPGTPTFVISTGTGTPSGGTSLGVQIQGAPDNGGGTIAGLTFTPYVDTDALPAASILASTRVATLNWPNREPHGAPFPRFIKVTYNAVGTWAGLTLNTDVTLGPDTANGTLQRYPANF